MPECSREIIFSTEGLQPLENIQFHTKSLYPPVIYWYFLRLKALKIVVLVVLKIAISGHFTDG